jgi:hypothetical protein
MEETKPVYDLYRKKKKMMNDLMRFYHSKHFQGKLKSLRRKIRKALRR